MKEEIDRIASTTDFNGKTLLNSSTSALKVFAGYTSSSLNIIKVSSANIKTYNTVSSFSNSSDARTKLDTIKAAIEGISTIRSTFGAMQNRLEHTIDNLDNVVENVTAAESRIRDTDMADEMVKYSKNNILTQAGQSMLAQANQSTQGALSLLG